MKKLLWKLLKLLDNNRGYDTPLQERFKVGDVTTISPHNVNEKLKIGEEVTIIEFGRYDYLVRNDNHELAIVYQFELNTKSY